MSSSYRSFMQLVFNKNKQYVPKIDWKNEKVVLSFDDGEILNLTMDDWFKALENANRIVSANSVLCDAEMKDD